MFIFSLNICELNYVILLCVYVGVPALYKIKNINIMCLLYETEMLGSLIGLISNLGSTWSP